MTVCQCDIALTPCGAYVVDVLHSNSAEVTAAVKSVPFARHFNTCADLHLFSALRALALSVSTALILPMIHTYGHLSTNAMVALLSAAGFGYVLGSL